LRYFLSEDIKLSEDKIEVTTIIEKTGSELPEIDLVFNKITKLLEQFAAAFLGYPLK
jgi:hypothetical protein